MRAEEMSCRDCPVRHFGLCRDMRTPEELSALEAVRAPVCRHPPHRVLYHQDDAPPGIFNLLDGWVCLYQLLPDGRRQILYFALPGAVFGLDPSQGQGINHSAEAITEIVLCSIPTASLRDLRNRFPSFGERQFWLVMRDEALSYEHLTSLGRRNARERLCHLLLELTVRSTGRDAVADGQQIAMPLTQTLIGDALGLTAIHVNRTLAHLRSVGVVDLHGRQLTVLSAQRLIELAGIGRDALRLWDDGNRLVPVASRPDRFLPPPALRLRALDGGRR